MLPHVIRHNGQQVEPWYGELVECVRRASLADRPGRAADAAWPRFVSEISRRPVWLVH